MEGSKNDIEKVKKNIESSSKAKESKKKNISKRVNRAKNASTNKNENDESDSTNISEKSTDIKKVCKKIEKASKTKVSHKKNFSKGVNRAEKASPKQNENSQNISAETLDDSWMGKSVNKPIQLGLCCLNTKLRADDPPIYSSRTTTVNKIKDVGIDICKERALLNLKDCLKMIEWNEKNGIKVLRLSSEMFPHFCNPKVPSYNMDHADDLMKSIGDLAKK